MIFFKKRDASRENTIRSYDRIIDQRYVSMADLKSLMEYASDKKNHNRNMVAGLPYLKIIPEHSYVYKDVPVFLFIDHQFDITR